MKRYSPEWYEREDEREPDPTLKPPFNLPEVEESSACGPQGCNDLTLAVLCVLAGAVAFVAFVAIAWGFA